jgi:hypothetical protein
LTVIVFDVPVIDDVTVSNAVMVDVPGVMSVGLNVPTPNVSVELAGSMAAESGLVKWTVPVYPVAGLLY